MLIQNFVQNEQKFSSARSRHKILYSVLAGRRHTVTHRKILRREITKLLVSVQLHIRMYCIRSEAICLQGILNKYFETYLIYRQVNTVFTQMVSAQTVR